MVNDVLELLSVSDAQGNSLFSFALGGCPTFTELFLCHLIRDVCPRDFPQASYLLCFCTFVEGIVSYSRHPL